MICIKTEIPKEICEIDDELKAIYHSRDTVCIWVFKSREDRNKRVFSVKYNVSVSKGESMEYIFQKLASL